jgi:hypothetical protein
LPESVPQQLLRWSAMINPTLFGIGLLVALAVVDIVLLILGIRRFQRTRLILD